jgi:hypothetical protein
MVCHGHKALRGRKTRLIIIIIIIITRYGASFAPEKYELIHLARKPRRFNMQAQISVEGTTKSPSPAVRILGVWVDFKLNWGEHVKIR